MILQGQDLLWDRLERYLKQKGIENPNKDSVAKRLRDRLGKMKDISELPEETTEKVVKLFQRIRKAFGEEESISAPFNSSVLRMECVTRLQTKVFLWMESTCDLRWIIREI